jgi:predicted DNA-binding protein
MGSSTSSFRISDDLKQQLETASRSMKKRKNWILTRALEEYLQRRSPSSPAAEARRQSLLVSRKDSDDSAFWERLADDRDWE